MYREYSAAGGVGGGARVVIFTSRELVVLE